MGAVHTEGAARKRRPPMSHRRGSVRFVALFASLAVVLGACGSSAKQSGAPASTVAPKHGGTLIIGAEQEPDCMDWIASCAGSSWGTWLAEIQTIPFAYRTVPANDKNTGDLKSVPGPVLTGEAKLETTPVQKLTYTIAPDAAWSGGPWVLKWNKGDSIVLTHNPKFWGTPPVADKVVFKFLPDTAAEFQAFKSGQVLAIYPQPQIDVVDAISAGGLTDANSSYNSNTATVEALWMNNSKPPFNSTAAPQALAYSLHPDALVQEPLRQLDGR